MGQPVDVSVGLSMELTTVDDILVVAHLLTDLGVPPTTPLDDAVTVTIDLPIREWTASHPSTLNLSLQTKSS